MKLFWFLVLCVFVYYVSTDELMEYKRSVSISNTLIVSASNVNVRRNTGTTNGLAYVIEQMLGDNFYSLELLNNMFAVPEYLFNWNVCMLMQENLRRGIAHHLHVRYTENPDSNFEGLRLIDLGEQRRRVTLVALKQLWNRAIVGDVYSVHWTCRMIALFISIKFPELISQDVGSFGTLCNVYNGFIDITYRKFEGRWWRVIGDDINTCVQLVPEPL